MKFEAGDKFEEMIVCTGPDSTPTSYFDVEVLEAGSGAGSLEVSFEKFSTNWDVKPRSDQGKIAIEMRHLKEIKIA